MRKQCSTQWDLKGTVLLFAVRSSQFNMVCWETGLLNQCNELAALLRWMPMEQCPVHVLWADEAVFSPVSKLCSAVWKKMLRTILLCFCCPVWNTGCWACSMERIPAQKEGMSTWVILKALFCVVLYGSSLLSQELGSPSFPQKRNCRFVACLLIPAFWTSCSGDPPYHKNLWLGDVFHLCCLKAAWKWMYSIPVSYHSLFFYHSICKIKEFGVGFLIFFS